MSEQQWEYCELCMSGWKEQKGKGYYYNVWVQYYGPEKGAFYQLAEMEGRNAKIFSYNPFTYALQLLGAAGWELVSHQMASGGDGFQATVQFRWDKRIAVFKRPVQAGRAVDEPKLIETVKP